MSLVSTPTIGLEEVQRKAFYVLFDGLNSVLAEMQTEWDRRDETFATRTGREFIRTVLEPIQPENFYEGHRPSLIDADVTSYPNVSVMTPRAVAGVGTDQQDHMEVHRNLLWIECMAKSEANEDEVNRRSLRLVEAVHITLMRNPTLEGIVAGFDTAVNANMGDVFTRKQRTAYGPHWFWRGGRLEYAVRKESAHPVSSGPVFPTAPVYDIDQA